MSEHGRQRTLAIVLNWRQPQITLACVQALVDLQEPLLDILVIDNGSGDDSVAVLKSRRNGYELVELAQNIGFAAGNNVGLRLALERGYDFALMINNDAFVAPGLLQNLVAEARSDVGLLSPKIFYESDPEIVWFAGGARHPLTLDLINTGRGHHDGQQFRVSRDVDYLLGACLLVNMQAVRVVGLLDERYFFYFEDLDWSIRFNEAGYRLRYVADASVYHRVAVSTGGDKDSALRRFYLASGGVIFWRRHAYLGNQIIIILFRAASAARTLARLLIARRWKSASAYAQGLRHGWRSSTRGRHITDLEPDLMAPSDSGPNRLRNAEPGSGKD